jgi:hypothetical protein
MRSVRALEAEAAEARRREAQSSQLLQTTAQTIKGLRGVSGYIEAPCSRLTSAFCWWWGNTAPQCARYVAGPAPVLAPAVGGAGYRTHTRACKRSAS